MFELLIILQMSNGIAMEKISFQDRLSCERERMRILQALPTSERSGKRYYDNITPTLICVHKIH